MKNKFLRLFVLSTSLLVSQQAAAAYECYVKVVNVLVYADGSVNVLHTGRNDYTVVCNLNTDRQGVSPTTCAVWFALLESVKKRNGTANIYFNGNESCATLPTYGSAPAPVYIGDMNS
jgi:hypothetical protein